MSQQEEEDTKNLGSENSDHDGASSSDPEPENDEESVEYEPPPCDKTNTFPFYKMCNLLEDLWSVKRQANVTRTEEERKKHLLPPKMLRKLEGQSLYPLFRLLMPDYDTSRNLYMKEKLIAQAYCDVEGFAKGTKNYEMLFEYTNQTKLQDCPELAGDISLVVEHILEQRRSKENSKMTIGQINDLLDELMATLQRNRRSHSHEWRQDSNKPPKEVSVKKRREQWLRKVMNRGLSPREHKWLVRILLKKMEFGLGAKSILNYYSRFANQLYESHNSLKNLCEKLADPAVHMALEEEWARKKAAEESSAADYRWEPQEQPAMIGNVISPMRSERVSFENCLTKLQENHQEYLKSLPQSTPAKIRNSLALNFPAFCAEIKLDGERMLYHIQDGKAIAQTRNGKLYSRIYTPVLGPALRQALSKYRVNVVLDGEVESWDDGRKQLIPFGSNRTVAINRQFYLAKHGMVEDIDQNLHENADGSITDPNVQRVGDALRFLKDQSGKFDDDHEPGKECWLQYLIFDILYVDGPDVKKLFRDCLMDESTIEAGSLTDYTLLQRKIILHQLITNQPSRVEIGKSIIVRPNGDCMRAEKYFSVREPVLDDNSHHPAFLDSTQAAIQEAHPPDISELDRKRRKGRSNEEISRLRTDAVAMFYNQIVDEQKMEGLVFKDLASPYVFGQASKSRKFWHKFKPDYDGGETIDVVILGAYFATGLRHSGQLSHFLCGILDDDHPDLFIPMLNVNGKSTSYDNLARILELTGYRKATSECELDLGKWEQRDANDDGVPDWISHRSFQDDLNEECHEGWKYSKTTFPDLWIKPDDSVVLELKGQEFVRSSEYSSGLTMRFPRIKRVRHELMDGDPKSAFEVDTHGHIRQLHYLTMLSRQSGPENSAFSPTASSSAPPPQKEFLTTEEYARSKQQRKRKRRTVPSPSKVPKVEQILSHTLDGIAFTALEGNYILDYDGLEAQDAKENGWFDEASKVRRKEDVMTFIQKHGGTIRVSVAGDSDAIILGGQANDARVVNYMRGIENARLAIESMSKSKKLTEFQLYASKEGVLKWTFVYSLVSRWLISHPRSMSIKEGDATFLGPKAYNFLSKATVQKGSNDHIFDLGNDAIVTKMDMLRVLEEYDEEAEGSFQSFPPKWQDEMVLCFGKEDRWIFNCPSEFIGMKQDSSNDNGAVSTFAYPDIFNEDRVGGDGSGLEEYQKHVLESRRWSMADTDVESEQLKSVLPLALAMGLNISPMLDSFVSHVLVPNSGAVRASTRGCLDRMDSGARIKLVKASQIISQWEELRQQQQSQELP